MFDLENKRHGHRVQLSQWCHSITNINLGKKSYNAFCDSYKRFGDINV